MQTYKTIDDILKQKPSSVTPDYSKYADYFAPAKQTTTPVRRPTPPEKLITPLAEPEPMKSDKPTNYFTAVGNSLLSSIINITRQTITTAPELRSTDIDKNQKQLEGIVDKLSPYLERSAKRITPIEGAISKPLARGIQEPHDKTYEFLSEQERAAQERANLENASGFTRLMGNVAGSLPLSLATRMPIAGWALMYNTTFKNSLEESLAKNPNATADDKNMMVLKATGDAALELGTEMIFGLFGRIFKAVKGAVPGSIIDATRGIVNMFKGTAKATARTALAETAEAAAKRLGQTYIKPTIRNVTKTILQQSGEEAIEEGLNYFGGAVLAKITTDKDRSLFKTRDGQEALFTWSGLFEASLTGAVSGGLITTARATPASISYYRNKNIFENLKTQMAETNSKTMEESGQEDADALLNAVDIDMQEPINQEFVSEQVLDVIQKNADTSQIPQEVFDEMTPQQTSAFLELNPDYVSDENGKPISIDQLRQTVAQGSTATTTPQGIQTPAQTVRTPTAGSAAPRVVSPNVGVSAPTTIRTRVKPNQYENITPVLVSANTVVPSHDAFGNPNEGYNTEYQPRGRERSASVGQMQQIVNETDYGLLSETGNVASGITTFNPDDSNVMSGNGRVAAMQEIYRRGGQPAERLRTEMLSLAESLGIDTTNAPANPIVSGVIPEGVDPVQFARDSNPEEGLAYSPAENAKNDARKITTKMLSEYADVDLGQTANQSFVSDLMSQFSPEERAAFQDKDGKLSQAGKQRIENAIFYKAFPNDALINLISESTDSHIKNTTNALRSVAGLVLKTKDMIANGEAYELDISNLIMASMERYIAMSNMPKPNGFESAIDAYFRQVPMEVVEMTPAEEGMVKLFYGFRSSRLQLAGWLSDYYNEIPRFGNPKEPSLMGMSTEPNSDAVLDRALLKAFGGEKFKYGLAKEEAQQSNEISITDFMGGGQQVEQALGGFADPVEEAAREVQSKQAEAKSESKVTAKAEETPRNKTTAKPAVKAAHQLTYNEYVKTHPRTERQQTALAAITDAVDSIGRSRLEDNGIIKADETVEQMAERYASEYKIKDINKKELWGSDSNVESFRKALLGYMRGRRAGFLEKGELHPRSQHEELIRSAIKSGKSIPDNVKAEYPELFASETKAPAEYAEQPVQKKAAPKKKVNKQTNEVPATQAVAEESQKQDRSGILGIVPEAVAKGMNLSPEKAPRRTGTYQDTISPKTRKRIDAAKDPYQKTTLKEWFAEFKKTFREYTTRGSVPVPIEKGDLRVQFRKVRTAKNQAKMLATRIIEQVYNPVGVEKKPLLDDAIMYLDLAEDIALGRYGDRIDLPFGQTPLEVLTTAKAIANDLKKPENEVVLKAMNLRKKLLASVRNDLIKSADRVGIDLDFLKNRQEYMYHAVIQYQKEYMQGVGKKRQSKKLAYLKRKGSNKDYVTDPVFADYMIIEKMVSDTYKLNLYNEIKKLDVSADLPLDEDGKYIIPDDYAEVDVSMVGMSNYNRYSRDHVVAAAEQSLKNLGIKENSDEWIDVITRANHEANQKTLVVPDYIPTALELEFGKKDSAVGKYPKMMMNAWKFTRLRLPGVVWSYNVRNMGGDLDAVMMGDLRTIEYVPSAVTELYKFYYNKGNVVISNDLADFINRTGMIGGQVAQELKSLKSHRTFAMYSKDVNSKSLTAAAIKKAWSALTMETSTEFREQILRYAAYKSFLDRLKESKTGTLKYYAASIPQEIDSITDIKDKAAKLATDLLGAYDDITIGGQYASDHVIPFFRFKEIQLKRNYRMMKNSFYKSPELMLSVGEGIVGSLKVGARGGAKIAQRVGMSSIIRVAKVAVGLTLFYGGLELFNHYAAGDEEDKLPESVKNVPHLTIPSWLSKDDRVRYIDRLGAFGEFMDMFGIDKDIGPDIKDVIAGRMSPKDKMLEIIMSPVKDIFNSAVPFAKMAFEVMSGQQYFPDPTDPRDIRDRWEYVFNIVGLKDEYNALAGKPMIEGSYLKHKWANLLTKSVLEGDAALWDMYAYEEDFYRRHDISQSSVKWERDQGDKAKKAKAVYYYKQALKLGDTKAAERYLKEYAFYGGTKTTLKQSMATMEPLYWVDKKYKDQMIEEMSEEEKETYERAKAWIKELQAIEKPNIDWTKKKPTE